MWAGCIVHPATKTFLIINFQVIQKNDPKEPATNLMVAGSFSGLFEELKACLKSHGTVLLEADFAKGSRLRFNLDESDAMFARTDPEVHKAVDMMPQASALLESAKKIIVQRMNAQHWAARLPRVVTL
jgi:hypothetical protein